LTLVKTKLLLGITVHGKDTLLWQGYSYKSLFGSSTFARWSFGKESFSLGQAKSQRKRAALLAWNTCASMFFRWWIEFPVAAKDMKWIWGH
jgi:hypothetical protein